ncbi:PREDICTED: dirigent protein 24 [Ipomoea nil]|uniref:dirigent protein 24 n=1 Tax=Ipomoea nil TaxID=35883 RepID=UPI000901633E|nr:PREDICTED: dirigent protein 24 [Ipomoea nil]
MAKFFLICIFFLVFTFGCTQSARILDEASPVTPLSATLPEEEANPPEIDDPVATPPVAPAVAAPGVVDPPETDDPEVAPPTASAVTAPAVNVVSPVAAVAPPPGAAPVAVATTPGTSSATVANPTTDHPALSFFMHDILGGSQPSGRVVTGIVANSNANNLPFTQPNDQLFPINGGVPLNTINNVINNNNYPFLVGLNGQQQTDTLLQNTGNNNVVDSGDNQPFVTGGQLPSGLNLQQLMFGSITVVDNQITEGHELGSAVLGRAQGFYLASSLDGTSHTLALTALFHGEHDHEHELGDTISFFGVHRTATPISHLAIIGGTGTYETAKGYATIETLPHVDQHTTDGVETITHFTVYITP